jgi:hypothetical protein
MGMSILLLLLIAEADERKDFLRSRPEGRGNSGLV